MPCRTRMRGAPRSSPARTAEARRARPRAATAPASRAAPRAADSVRASPGGAASTSLTASIDSSRLPRAASSPRRSCARNSIDFSFPGTSWKLSRVPPISGLGCDTTLRTLALSNDTVPLISAGGMPLRFSPAKSITIRRVSSGPAPMRVATTCASGSGFGIRAPQWMR